MRRMSSRTDALELERAGRRLVSGEPNITPIFSRSWFVNTHTVPLRLSEPASLRSAWLMRRAWMPPKESPISPSSSASARAPRRRSMRHRRAPSGTSTSKTPSAAASPSSGCETEALSMSTPIRAYLDPSSARRSMNEHVPPAFWARRGCGSRAWSLPRPPGRRSRRCARRDAGRHRARGRATASPSRSRRRGMRDSSPCA